MLEPCRVEMPETAGMGGSLHLEPFSLLVEIPGKLGLAEEPGAGVERQELSALVAQAGPLQRQEEMFLFILFLFLRQVQPGVRAERQETAEAQEPQLALPIIFLEQETLLEAAVLRGALETLELTEAVVEEARVGLQERLI